MKDVLAGDDELLGVEAVARALDVQPVTIYRWCREGRLPCLKLGKTWRIRHSALVSFLQQAERRRTLVDHLAAFLTVPDQVVAIASDEELLARLDAAFFKVGEARGGLLVKFYGGESRPVAALRAGLQRNGLDVDRLEAEGRFRWSAEVDPAQGRAAALRQFLPGETATGRAVWASFNWTRQVDLATALGQQDELAAVVGAAPLVVKTAVLEEVADAWPPAAQRHLRQSRRALVWVTPSGLVLSRAVPLPTT